MSLQIFNERQADAIRSIHRVLEELPPADVHATVAGVLCLTLDVLGHAISLECVRNLVDSMINGLEQSPQPLMRDGRH